MEPVDMGKEILLLFYFLLEMLRKLSKEIQRICYYFWIKHYSQKD
jgi:hypothetical protein